MAKQTKGKTAPPPRTPKRLYQSILAVAVIGSMVAVYFYAGRDTSSGMIDAEGMAQSNPTGVTPTNPALRNRLILPAIPQRPRPITLAPEQFTNPEVHQAYLAAKDAPEALETVACYCGCYSEARHRNNLDCYKDNHGVTWALCRTIALEAQRLHKMGTPLEKIKPIVDEKYAPRTR